MTIEELARALLDALQAQGTYVGELETPDGSVVIDGEICPASVVRALLPFIAAELAGVARGRAEKFRIVKEQLEEAMMVKATNDARIIENSYRDAAHAIEAHARKMGEA